MFKKIEGAEALLHISGVYKPAQIYEMDGLLYAAYSGGYVVMKENGSTSKDKVGFSHLTYDGPLFRDKWGKIATSAQHGTAIENTTALKLEKHQ